MHESRVLERHAQAAREGREQALVGLAERMLAVEVLQRDKPRGRAAGEQGDQQRRLRLGVGHLRQSEPLSRTLHVLFDQHRLACLDHHSHEREALQRVGIPGLVLSPLDGVLTVRKGCRGVVRPDVDHLRVEDLLDLVADDLIDRLHFELAGERRLHAVDQRQLGIALPRLLDRAGARKRGADVLPDEREQLLVLLGVVGAQARLVRRDGERPHRPPLRTERNAQPVLGGCPDPRELTLLDELVPLLERGMQGLPGPEYVGRGAVCFTRAELEPLLRVGGVGIEIVGVVGPADQATLFVVERDPESLRIHELADDLVDRAVELLHVLGRARELRDAVERALDPLPVFARHRLEYRACAATRLV